MERIARAPADPTRPLAVSVVRVPFFLEPEYPESEDFSETNRARLERKWGGRAGWEAQKRRHGLKERALEAGIAEPIDLDRHASNTLKSHRLVQHVSRTRGLEASERLYDALNVAHFIQGHRLNDASRLAKLAAEHAGLPEEEALAFLATEQGRGEIEATLALVRQLGISSIPTFVVDGQHVLNGAAHADEHERVLREVERVGPTGRSCFAHALNLPLAGAAGAA